jgi:hypothetical protein
VAQLQQQQQQQQLGAAMEVVDLTGEESEPETNIKLEPAAVSNAGAAPDVAPSTGAAAVAAPTAAADTSQPAMAAAAAAAAPASFTLKPFSPSNVPGALAQLMLLLDAMSAADELVERLPASAELLAGLHGPAGQQSAAAAAGRLQLLQAHYATVQLWARRGKFDEAAGVIDAMLRGLGV